LLVLFGGLVLPTWLFSPVFAQTAAESAGTGAGEQQEYAARAPRSFHRNGVYLGLAATYALSNFDLDGIEDATGFSLDSTNSWGINGRVGYRFHPNLAAELNAEWYQEFEFETGNGLDAVRFDGYTLTANGKFFFLTGRLQPYLLGGVGIMDMDIDGGAFQSFDRDRLEFVGRVGPGLDFYLFDDIVLNVEATYLIPTGSLSDYQMASFVFGAQYRF